MTSRARFGSWLPPLLPLLFSLGAAEIAVRLNWVPSYLIPAPSEVLRSLIEPMVLPTGDCSEPEPLLALVLTLAIKRRSEPWS